MKKDTAKIVAAIIVLIEGIALLSCGIILDTLWLTILGGVFCGIYVIISELCVIQIIRQTAKEKLKETNNNQAEFENEMVKDVNSTHGLENYINVRAHQFANISHAWKVASVLERVWLVFLSVTFIGCFAAMIAFICLNYLVACAIAFGVQVVLVGGTLIVAKLIEKSSLAELDVGEYAEPCKGKVVACSLHTQTTVSKGQMSRIEYKSKYNIQSKMTTRITSIVYKVKIDLGNKKVVAFSREFYNEGDEVLVYQNKKHKRIYKIAK